MTKAPSKIIFTSDWHLGKRQYGLKHREQDRYRAAWHVLKQAAEMGAAAVLNGGDILDVTRPTSRAVNELKRMHAYLKTHDIPMYLVQGNHDRTSPPWFDLFIEENNTEGGVILLEKEKVDIPGTDVSVYGVPEMPVESLTEHLRSDEAPEADILLTHIMVRDWIGFKSPNSFELKNLPQDKYSHAVIGDVHKTAIERHGKVTCVSPGSIELGASDEQQTKYFQVFDCTTRQTESKIIPTRPVVFVEILSEEQVEEGLKELAEADKVESLIYLTCDPTINGIVNRALGKKTKSNTYIDTKTQVNDNIKLSADDEDDDRDDELRTFESFAPEFSEDSAVVSAFGKVVSTDNAMDDIVEELVADVTKQK